MRTHRVFAAVYDRTNASAERAFIGQRRAHLVGGLTGVVLDVGAGTGANFPHYRAADRIVATEPDPAMRAKLVAKLKTTSIPVDVSEATAESLPFDTASFDAVVCTFVLCTVTDPAAALAEIRRVLRPGGKLVVLEHVRGENRLGRWQDRLAPLWAAFTANCRPNRHTRQAIEEAGFDFDEVEEFTPLPKWALIRTMLQGSAQPRPA
ncbi:SAM-dependent methyltransferase [Prauserella marina]|uniref:Ubiquinone/menaquinone biosynthesis C-methylase UbiE n=1 Tax=Prauserella marina TaxID=530584 RepID=A0A222VIY0_9PSEU|nr:class I SAM-dependent methyltransferase [Prauserella marina]ASR33889.1 SAM-dependent methyltransferase [Prauserella marina]PWV82484.1 ubiquinone/menaquinone biosynthesis C-methylase UbiE [Prauserella marina]SDC70301.1 Ubiquinone/menaquinone biosynthesis C-methylase UbiE [Prauserella marina]